MTVKLLLINTATAVLPEREAAVAGQLPDSENQSVISNGTVSSNGSAFYLKLSTRLLPEDICFELPLNVQ
jgi:hypothetical protein